MEKSDSERVNKKFLRKISKLNYKLNSFYQKGISPGSDEEPKFIKFLKEIVSLKVPIEIQNDDDVFEALFSLQSEARQTLREISWGPC